MVQIVVQLVVQLVVYARLHLTVMLSDKVWQRQACFVRLGIVHC